MDLKQMSETNEISSSQMHRAFGHSRHMILRELEVLSFEKGNLISVFFFSKEFGVWCMLLLPFDMAYTHLLCIYH